MIMVANTTDSAWINDFKLQLASQKMPSAAISRAVEDVDSHCVDSGQSPREAFGEPREYAAVLASEMSPAPPDRGYARRRVASLLPLTLGLAAGVSWAFTDESTSSISLGQILFVVVIVPAWVFVTAPLAPARSRDARTPERRAFDERGWRGLWASLGLAAAGVALWITLDQTVFHLPTWVVGVVAAVLLVCGLVAGRFASVKPGQ
ncbi:hypothetical protein ACWT_6853 [Actinoplanes sp. SE50]|uniref:hypothetical protein n=1 Tax=unclassified Actinoplanes TaxID=2626549 RepID=UPI00023ED4FB|nr:MULTISPECIES: hypothetical protein [unclassified Actinoplanes]AEV87866.1 hypothetical protein ACPL_6984 [Actinoplanes sp. SE50/110]ATO86268.1 hypothetical protein ACWT_6853 [Actinoplanes sp. SE50]SLM03683.1 hypothetical protein ACSP50_6979 [Actinoplanes sp. SE50/110]